MPKGIHVFYNFQGFFSMGKPYFSVVFDKKSVLFVIHKIILIG